MSEATIGLTAIGAALFGTGIPKNSVLQYKMAIKIDGNTSRCGNRRSRRRDAPVTCTS